MVEVQNKKVVKDVVHMELDGEDLKQEIEILKKIHKESPRKKPD